LRRSMYVWSFYDKIVITGTVYGSKCFFNGLESSLRPKVYTFINRTYHCREILWPRWEESIFQAKLQLLFLLLHHCIGLISYKSIQRSFTWTKLHLLYSLKVSSYLHFIFLNRMRIMITWFIKAIIYIIRVKIINPIRD